MKNFNLTSAFSGIIIGALVGALGYYTTVKSELYELNNYKKKLSKYEANKLQSEDVRIAFFNALNKSQNLDHTRGRRIPKQEYNKMKGIYGGLQASVNGDPIALGIQLGSGFSFGYTPLKQLLDDMVKENELSDSTNYISGIRVHLGIKKSIISGVEGMHIDGVITPVRQDGSTVDKWENLVTTKNVTPPYLDDSNPCPDACP